MGPPLRSYCYIINYYFTSCIVVITKQVDLTLFKTTNTVLKTDFVKILSVFNKVT